jgi:hypothetical protein
MKRGAIQNILALLQQTLCELLGCRKLSRSLLTFNGSSISLSLSLCSRSLLHADDTIPPTTSHTAVAEQSGSDQIETESDGS